jgi:hypothetical protein
MYNILLNKHLNKLELFINFGRLNALDLYRL